VIRREVEKKVGGMVALSLLRNGKLRKIRSTIYEDPDDT